MITIIDYGMGNIGSLENMLKRVGGKVRVSSEADAIRNAEKLILPGVGHFDQAMQRLEDLNLVSALNEAVIDRKIPILCICLGAQLVTERSEEGGSRKGLGWVEGSTKRFQLDSGYRVPHMGWNDINVTKESRLFRGLPPDPCFYFVHSYHLVLTNPQDVLATANYGYEFVAALERGNIFAMQYHPEKSHKYGLCVMRNFVELSDA